MMRIRPYLVSQSAVGKVEAEWWQKALPNLGTFESQTVGAFWAQQPAATPSDGE
jgi:hypothetical protein